MPPAFVPLIGSSFDALNAQRYAWQGRNDQVQAQNIARANAAQEAQNRYRFDVSRMIQDAQIRDARAREAAQSDSINLAFAQRKDAEDRRRFDVGTGLDRERISADKRRYQFAADKETKAIEEYDKAQENFANKFQEPFAKTGQKLKSIEQEYATAQEEAMKLEQALQTLPSEDAVKLLAYGSPERAKVEKDISEAQSAYTKAMVRLAISKERSVLTRKQLEELANRAKSNGLEVDLENFTFFRPRDNRTFAFPQTIAANPTPAFVGPPAPQDEVESPAAMLPAFVPQTQTATNQPAPTTQRPPVIPLPRGGGTMMDFSQPNSGPKLTVEGATFFLKEAKGNKALARQLAKEAGYVF